MARLAWLMSLAPAPPDRWPGGVRTRKETDPRDVAHDRRRSPRSTSTRCRDGRRPRRAVRRCVFWELDPVAGAARRATRRRRRRPGSRAVLRDWGSCGRVALVDDGRSATLLYAPAAYVPGRRRLPHRAGLPGRRPADRGVRRPRRTRGGGLGRMLVQGMARDLIERGGIAAVEAFGDTRGPGRLGPAGAAWSRSDFLAQRGLQDPAGARDHAADADGAAARADLEGRGRGGAGAAARASVRAPARSRRRTGEVPIAGGDEERRARSARDRRSSGRGRTRQAMNSASSLSSVGLGARADDRLHDLAALVDVDRRDAGHPVGRRVTGFSSTFIFTNVILSPCWRSRSRRGSGRPGGTGRTTRPRSRPGRACRT